MKFLFLRMTVLAFVFSLSSHVSAQSLVDKIFSDKPADFKSQIEITDTLVYDYYTWDENYYYSYETRFGLKDFEHFLIYKNKSTNKKGLIVYGSENSFYTPAVADSIYFLSAEDLEFNEYYDDLGNYYSFMQAKKLHFYFDQNSGEDELWAITCDTKYNGQKDGNVKSATLRAVKFSEVIDADGYSHIYAVFANLDNNSIFTSSVLNETLVRNEVYAYHYDSYYGEYDYYYNYEAPESDYSVPTFETRMNYETVTVNYIEKNDTIHQLVNYVYSEVDPYGYIRKALSDDYSGVWGTPSVQTADYEEGYSTSSVNPTMYIIDGDDIWTGYGVYLTSVDSYKNSYKAGIYSLSEITKRIGIGSELDSKWKGSKDNVHFIELYTWTQLSRYKDFFIYNDQVMAHVAYELDENNNKKVTVEFFDKQKVYEKYAIAKYDSYYYTTVLVDENGNNISLADHGIDYYYNYNLAVADRNIDKDGNLILTDESLGSITFKAYNAGSNYLGKVKVQWIENADLNEGGTIVTIKSMPYKIVDQQGAAYCDDIAAMSVVNVAGFNVYQIYNSQNKSGLLGPDGKWLVKPEWDGVNVVGPPSAGSYYYDSYSYTINLPVFFTVLSGEKWGALDSKGNMIIPAIYEYIEICGNQILATKDSKLTIFSFDGKMLLDNLDGVASSYYGYASDCYSFDYTANGDRVLVKDGKYGIVNSKFEQVIPFSYAYIQQTTNGNFIASEDGTLYGMIDGKGNKILEFEYDFIAQFDYQNNRFVASKDGNQGVVNEKGETIIPFQYYSISTGSDWSSNMIYISDPDYRTNIIDTNGKSIISAECSYVYYYPGYEIFYCSTNDGQFQYYDRSGNLLYSKVMFYIDPYSAYDAIQIAQMGDYDDPRYGAFDLTTGNDMMPYEFESLYPFWIDDMMFFAGTKNSKIGIYTIDGVELVKPKGMYLENYYYNSGYYDDSEEGYFVEISNKKGKIKKIKLNF